jgi:hypothetical protein
MHDMNVVVPKPRKLVNERTGLPLKNTEGELPELDMYGFMIDVPLASPKVGKGSPGLRLRERIMDLFRNAKGGDVVKVAAGDYERIMEILRDYDWGYMTIAGQYLPFLDALEKATEDKPKLESVPDAPATP